MIAITFLKSVLKQWQMIIILALLALAYYQNHMEIEWLGWAGFRTFPGIELELKQTKEQLEECENSRTELKGSIEESNRQVDKWFNVSEQLKREQAKLNESFIRFKAESAKQVQEILDAPSPATCDGAIQYLRDSAQGVVQ